jgi:predicted ATP-grasp superfamily ATP-dependent carboligase
MVFRLAAIVLDGNLRAALVATRSLGRGGRTVGLFESEDSPRPVGFASRWPQVCGTLPSHRAGPATFVEALVSLLEERPANIVMAVSDATVAVLNGARERIDPHARVALASSTAVDVAVDKVKTLAVAASVGVPVPRGVVVRESWEAKEAARLVGFPAVVKPTTSWSAESQRLGRLECTVVLGHAELSRSVDAILRAGVPAIVQQWLSGRREAVHVMYADGGFSAAVGVATSRTYPALGGNSVLRETIPLPPDTTSATERLVCRLGLEGYSEVEFRRDAGGQPVLMEINPRLSASVEVAVRAGVDFPNLIYDWATGQGVRPVGGYRTGVRLRWLGGDIRWLRQAALAQGQPDVPPLRHAAAIFFSDFFRRSNYDYLDVSDVRPAAVAAASMVREVAERRLRHGRTEERVQQ